MKRIPSAFIVLILLLAGCTGDSDSPEKTTETTSPIREVIDRESKFPPGQVKITPETDLLPPILHSEEYSEPVPAPYPINTNGAEDSGFIMPDGKTFYVWFTPDPNSPLSEQLDDGVTGIYEFKLVNGEWQQPERVWLQDPGKQSLDGCEFVQDCVMWFCTARTGYTGLHWFKAECTGDGSWGNWQPADFPGEYEVGELHITAEGRELYFHSSRGNEPGEYDIWVSTLGNGQWQPPVKVAAVNSPEVDGWPSLTQDGNELWFTRFYHGSPAIFRSERINGEWQEPELIVSQFAGESSIDNEGNVYFTHHFYKDGVMLEADIYVIYKK
ncbi:MAG: hypothetical protein PVG61_01280 [Dehalococcoidia bacterium]